MQTIFKHHRLQLLVELTALFPCLGSPMGVSLMLLYMNWCLNLLSCKHILERLEKGMLGDAKYILKQVTKTKFVWVFNSVV